MKKLVVGALVMSLAMASCAYADEKPVDKFTDVGVTHWAMHDINELVARGIINGYPDSTFRPEGTITTSEFIKIVSSLDGKAIEKTSEHWASGYIDYAVKEGYVKEDMFSPEEYDRPINRQKMAVVMAIVSDKKDSEKENAKVTTEKINKLKTAVKDYSEICDYCKDYIAKAMLKGIITGYPDKTFKPANTATRAEAVTMIRRVIDPSTRKEIDLNDKKKEPIKKGIVKQGDFLEIIDKLDNDAFQTLLYITKQEMKDAPNYVEREKKNYNYTIFNDPSVFKMKYKGKFSEVFKGKLEEWHLIEMQCNATMVILLDKDFKYLGRSSHDGEDNDSKVINRLFELNKGIDNQGIDMSGDPTDPRVKYLAWREKTSVETKGQEKKGEIYIVENNIDYKIK